MIVFLYLCILLFIIALILYLLNLVSKNSPIKIKKYYMIILSALLVRYILLIIGVLVEKQNIIYKFRYLYNINIICIPLLALGSIYIFLREQDRSFDYNYTFLVLMTIGYVIGAIYFKSKITIDNNFGFIVVFKKDLTPNLIYLIIISSITVFSLLFMDKPYCNSFGMKILMCASIIVIVEFIFLIGGKKLFPYPIMGEAAILLTTLKTIKTFK